MCWAPSARAFERGPCSEEYTPGPRPRLRICAGLPRLIFPVRTRRGVPGCPDKGRKAKGKFPRAVQRRGYSLHVCRCDGSQAHPRPLERKPHPDSPPRRPMSPPLKFLSGIVNALQELDRGATRPERGRMKLARGLPRMLATSAASLSSDTQRRCGDSKTLSSQRGPREI